MLKVNVGAFVVLSLGQPPIRIIPSIIPKPTPLEYPMCPKHPRPPGHLCASAVCRPFMGPINSMLHLPDQMCLARFESQSSYLSSAVVPAHNLILIGLTAETTGAVHNRPLPGHLVMYATYYVGRRISYDSIYTAAAKCANRKFQMGTCRKQKIHRQQ